MTCFISGGCLPIERDPWGRSFWLVLGKLRSRTPLITESMAPALLEETFDTLFSVADNDTNAHRDASINMMCILLPPLVTEEVLFAMARRMRIRNTASGPDGVPGRVLEIASNILSGTIIDLSNVCLVKGKFPTEWRRADLILLPKLGKRDWRVSSSYRPICLINEAVKMLEKVIAYRVWARLNQVGPNLSDVQFGIRADLSTMDAIGWSPWFVLQYLRREGKG